MKNAPNNITDCLHCQTRLKSAFCDLGNEDVELLQKGKGCSTYKNGQFVFNQGAFPHGLFILNSGKVKIYQLSDNGKEQIVRMAKSGDIIGYRALLSNDKYTSTAEALVESSICYIPRSLFFGFLERNASVSIMLMRLLSHDLKNAERKMTDLAQKSVRERMAEALLYMKETYGFEQDQSTINVILTREEVANIAGTSTETAIRILSDFKQEKIVTFLGKKIKVLDLRTLIHVANLND